MNLFRFYFKKSFVSLFSLAVIVISSYIFFSSNLDIYKYFPINSESEFNTVSNKFVLSEMMSGVYTSTNEEIRDAFKNYYSDREKYSNYQNNIIDKMIAVKDYKGDYGYFNLNYFITEEVNITDGFVKEMNSRIEKNTDKLTTKELEIFKEMKTTDDYEKWISYVYGNNTEYTENIVKYIDFNEYEMFYDDINYLLFYNTDYDGYKENIESFNLSKEFSIGYIEYTSVTLTLFVILFVVFNNMIFSKPEKFISISNSSTKKIFFSKILSYIIFFSILIFIQLLIHTIIINIKISNQYDFEPIYVLFAYLSSLSIVIFTISISEIICSLLKNKILSIPILIALIFLLTGSQLKETKVYTVIPRYISFDTILNFNTFIYNRLLYLCISLLLFYITYRVYIHKRVN